MKQTVPRNVAAFVRQRLLNIAHRDGSDFAGLLTRYALERLLYRLGESRYRDQYVLKGAMLFHVWTAAAHRPTRDLDLLGRGDPSPERCQIVFREICGLPVATDDGLIFVPESVGVEKIKDGMEYEGVRVKFVAKLENARIAIQVDVGFGDAVMPRLLQYPTVLPMPAPQIQAYPMETVIAEKMEAIVSLGMLNTRMKDFFDIWFLAQTFRFDGRLLHDALRATFARRKTELSSGDLAKLLNELAGDESKQTQWRAFLRKSSLIVEVDLGAVNRAIHDFLVPLAGGKITQDSASMVWEPGGPWQEAAADGA